MPGQDDPPQPMRLRVFLSSPGDVRQHRETVRDVLRGVAKEPAYRGRVLLEDVSWDDPHAPVAMPQHLDPQAAVDAGLPRPSECDVVLVLLWSRMGTPLAEDRHRKPDGRPYRSGTEYEYLDALAAAEATGGRPYVLTYRCKDPAAVDMDAFDYDQQEAQRRSLRDFFEELQGEDGALRRIWHEFTGEPRGRDGVPPLREQVAAHLRAELDRRLKAAAPAAGDAGAPAEDLAPQPRWQGCPFRGLEAFEEAHADIFRGRETEVDALVARLASGERALMVIGDSGTGKSSLVRAGLLPRLAAGALPGSAGWRRAVLTPRRLGDDPLLALAAAVHDALPASRGRAVPSLRARLEAAPAALSAVVAEALNDDGVLLLFVDQLEEVFAGAVDETARQRFLACLLAAAASPRLRLLGAMRRDFYARWPQDEDSVALLERAHFPLAPPGPGALRRMAGEPAELAGLRFEPPGLLDRIVADTTTGRNALALMELALTRLWELEHEGGVLRERTYDERVGGVAGAVDALAEGALADARAAGEACDDATCALLFSRIARAADEEAGAVRQRARPAQLGRALALADRLCEARILTTGTDDRGAYREVVHEAVLRHWQRLADWLGASREDLALVERAEAQARDWAGDPAHPANQPWPHEAQQILYTALRRLGRDRDTEPEPLRGFLRPEAERLLNELQEPGTDPFRRAVIGDDLARIGDPRPGVAQTVTVNGRRLPVVDWVTVPPGDVELEKQAGTYHVVQFVMARYPVTNAQFRCFVDDRGCEETRWWCGFESRRDESERPAPPTASYPRTTVSWYEAVAFCRWLDARLREAGAHPATDCVVRLPTEWEWQQAASGGEPGREYPWSGLAPGAAEPGRLANIAETRYGRTMAVGLFPAGATAQGLLDMAGNVWEWCQNRYQVETAASAVLIDDSDKERALRGGSWRYTAADARCGYRYWGGPWARGGNIGFRVCCSSPID